MTYTEKEKIARAWLIAKQNEKNNFTAITTSVLIGTVRYLEKIGYFKVV